METADQGRKRKRDADAPRKRYTHKQAEKEFARLTAKAQKFGELSNSSVMLVSVSNQSLQHQAYASKVLEPVQQQALKAAVAQVEAARAERSLELLSKPDRDISLSQLSHAGLRLLACISINALVVDREQKLPFGWTTAISRVKEVLPWLPSTVHSWHKPDCDDHRRFWSATAVQDFMEALVANCSLDICSNVYRAVLDKKHCFGSCDDADQLNVCRALRQLMVAAGKGEWQAGWPTAAQAW